MANTNTAIQRLISTSSSQKREDLINKIDAALNNMQNKATATWTPALSQSDLGQVWYAIESNKDKAKKTWKIKKLLWDDSIYATTVERQLAEPVEAKPWARVFDAVLPNNAATAEKAAWGLKWLWNKFVDNRKNAAVNRMDKKIEKNATKTEKNMQKIADEYDEKTAPLKKFLDDDTDLYLSNYGDDWIPSQTTNEDHYSLFDTKTSIRENRDQELEDLKMEMNRLLAINAAEKKKQLTPELKQYDPDWYYARLVDFLDDEDAIKAQYRDKVDEINNEYNAILNALDGFWDVLREKFQEEDWYSQDSRRDNYEKARWYDFTEQEFLDYLNSIEKEGWEAVENARTEWFEKQDKLKNKRSKKEDFRNDLYL